MRAEELDFDAILAKVADKVLTPRHFDSQLSIASLCWVHQPIEGRCDGVKWKRPSME